MANQEEQKPIAAAEQESSQDERLEKRLKGYVEELQKEYTDNKQLTSHEKGQITRILNAFKNITETTSKDDVARLIARAEKLMTRISAVDSQLDNTASTHTQDTSSASATPDAGMSLVERLRMAAEAKASGGSAATPDASGTTPTSPDTTSPTTPEPQQVPEPKPVTPSAPATPDASTSLEERLRKAAEAKASGGAAATPDASGTTSTSPDTTPATPEPKPVAPSTPTTPDASTSLEERLRKAAEAKASGGSATPDTTASTTPDVGTPVASHDAGTPATTTADTGPTTPDAGGATPTSPDTTPGTPPEKKTAEDLFETLLKLSQSKEKKPEHDVGTKVTVSMEGEDDFQAEVIKAEGDVYIVTYKTEDGTQKWNAILESNIVAPKKEERPPTVPNELLTAEIKQAWREYQDALEVATAAQKAFEKAGKRKNAKQETIYEKGAAFGDARQKAIDAKAAYEAMRAEFIGEKVNNILDQKLRGTQETVDELLNKHETLAGQSKDAWKKIVKGMDWLAGINLESMGWKPKGKVKRFIAKSVSLRTLTFAGLTAVAGSTGILGYTAWRGFRGGLASESVYAALRNKEVSKEKVSGLLKSFDAKELKKKDAKKGYVVSDKDISDRLSAIEARCTLDGLAVEESEYFELHLRLSKELSERAELRAEKIDEYLNAQSSQIELSFADITKKYKSKKVKHMAIAGATGLIAASGVVGRGFRALGDAASWVNEKLGIWETDPDIPPMDPSKPTITRIPEAHAPEDMLETPAVPEDTAAPETEAPTQEPPAAEFEPRVAASEYEIKKGQGFLHAANHFQKDPALKAQIIASLREAHAGDPAWEKYMKSDRSLLRHWRVEQFENQQGKILGDNKWQYDKVVHAGAKVTLVFDNEGPRLVLGEEKVTTPDTPIVRDYTPKVEAVAEPTVESPPQVEARIPASEAEVGPITEIHNAQMLGADKFSKVFAIEGDHTLQVNYDETTGAAKEYIVGGEAFTPKDIAAWALAPEDSFQKNLADTIAKDVPGSIDVVEPAATTPRSAFDLGSEDYGRKRVLATEPQPTEKVETSPADEFKRGWETTKQSTIQTPHGQTVRFDSLPGGTVQVTPEGKMAFVSREELHKQFFGNRELPKVSEGVRGVVDTRLRNIITYNEAYDQLVAQGRAGDPEGLALRNAIKSEMERVAAATKSPVSDVFEVDHLRKHGFRVGEAPAAPSEVATPAEVNITARQRDVMNWVMEHMQEKTLPPDMQDKLEALNKALAALSPQAGTPEGKAAIEAVVKQIDTLYDQRPDK